MQISREELYRRVWEMPVRILAQELDISDVRLAKACRKVRIPLPPVGYWMKVLHGKKVVKPDLPKSDILNVQLDAFRHRIHKVDLGPKVPKPKELKVVVPAHTDQLVRFADATFKRLLKTNPDREGLHVTKGRTVFSCSVGPEQFDRTARILHSIEVAMPGLGGFFIGQKEKDVLNFLYEGQPVEFRIWEKVTTSVHVEEHPKHKWMNRTTYSYALTGNLTFSIDGYFDGQKNWSDGTRARLDVKVGDIVIGLLAAAKALKQREIDLEMQRLRWAEEARLREQRERQHRENEAFRNQLLAETRAWKECQTARAYLASLRKEIHESTDTMNERAMVWLNRAEEALVHMDPIAKRVRSFL